MKNSYPLPRQKKTGSMLPLSERKLLSHLSGIKIVKQGKIPADIQKNEEIYDLAILPAFALCACYLGYTNYRVLGQEKVMLPIDRIWDLFNFTSGLTVGRQIIDWHLMVIEKACELLGFPADLSFQDPGVVVLDGISKIMLGEKGKMKYVGFDERGINPEIFSQMLMHTLIPMRTKVSMKIPPYPLW
jgi:hypothetical protein